MRDEHAEWADARVVYLCRRERASEMESVVFSSSGIGGMVIVKELLEDQHSSCVEEE